MDHGRKCLPIPIPSPAQYIFYWNRPKTGIIFNCFDFLGLISKDRHKAILEQTQVKFAQTMGIEITRIQDLRLDVDIADLYVHATLLDRTPTDGMCSA